MTARRFLSACLWLVIGPIPAQRLPEAQDRTVALIAIAGWKGNYAVDRTGRGGLAALHAWNKQLLQKLSPSETLLVHAGTFTSATTQQMFDDQIKLPAPGLPSYLKMVLGLSAPELAWAELSKQDVPSVEWDTKATKTKPFLTLARSDQKIFITSISPANTQIASLRAAFDAIGKDGASMGVFLFPAGGSVDVLSRLPISDIHGAQEKGIGAVIIEPAEKNLFFRDPSGPFICRIAGRSVCYLEVKFRNQTVIGINQKFIDLNGASEPAAFVKPDATLMDLFGKQ